MVSMHSLYSNNITFQTKKEASNPFQTGLSPHLTQFPVVTNKLTCNLCTPDVDQLAAPPWCLGSLKLPQSCWRYPQDGGYKWPSTAMARSSTTTKTNQNHCFDGAEPITITPPENYMILRHFENTYNFLSTGLYRGAGTWVQVL